LKMGGSNRSSRSVVVVRVLLGKLLLERVDQS
jgi:hypothetical protein